MIFEFIANACGVFTSQSGKRILCDPWIDDGVFEGSWCHIHKLKTKFEDLENVDAIYLSHIHPDHFDQRFFKYRKDIPIFVLDHGFNFLHRNLEMMGYKNLVKIKDGETIYFEDYKITLFAPFVTNPFFENIAEVGNLIDSAMVLESKNIVALNANDNTPDQKSCRMLKERFGKIDLAAINYNAAGPYPSCFNNLNEQEKKEEHNKILNRNFEFLAANCEILMPKAVLPFAGAYAIGGRLAYKNQYLGTTTWDECAEYLEKHLTNTKVICLRENDIVNLEDLSTNKPYQPLDPKELDNYIKQNLSHVKYDYEMDEEVNYNDLISDIKVAKTKMAERCKKVSLTPDMQVNLEVDTKLINICQPIKSNGTLNCSLDPRLLRRILDRKAHWNNAEIGCHIEFYREPNYYSPDIHTMLQFLHL